MISSSLIVLLFFPVSPFNKQRLVGDFCGELIFADCVLQKPSDQQCFLFPARILENAKQMQGLFSVLLRKLRFLRHFRFYFQKMQSDSSYKLVRPSLAIVTSYRFVGRSSRRIDLWVRCFCSGVYYPQFEARIRKIFEQIWSRKATPVQNNVI